LEHADDTPRFALGPLGDIIYIVCCNKGVPVKNPNDTKLGRATVTIAITILAFALLWLLVTAVLAVL